jgi:hypothetical protein
MSRTANDIRELVNRFNRLVQDLQDAVNDVLDWVPWGLGWAGGPNRRPVEHPDQQDPGVLRLAHPDPEPPRGAPHGLEHGGPLLDQKLAENSGYPDAMWPKATL